MTERTSDDILLSVIIIFYNQEKYVRQTLESVLSQKTDFKFEILMGDDNSTDKTTDILKEYSEKYPEVCRYFLVPGTKERKYKILERQTDNRIYLLGFTKGQYVNFLDGDDYYTTDTKFQKQIDILEKHPEISGCFHPFNYHYEKDGRDEEYVNLGDREMVIKNNKFWRRYYAHSATFIFRNKYSRNTEVLKGKIFDDSIITLWHIGLSDVYYIPDNAFAYRQLEESTWNKISVLTQSLINIRNCDDLKKISREHGYKLENAIDARFRNTYRDVFRARKEINELPDVTGGFSDNDFATATLNYGKKGILYDVHYVAKYALFFCKVCMIRLTGKISDIFN